MLSTGLIGLLLLLGSFGGLLVIVGIVGKRIGTPPSCWRCRFDLSGDENIRKSTYPVTCPECGFELRGPGDVRLRIRQSRKPAWLAGLAAGGLSLAGLATVAAATGGSMNLLTVASTSQLLSMADSGSFQAFAEIQTRADSARLSNEEWASIHDRVAAAIQEVNPSTNSSRWDYEWESVDWTSFYPDLVSKGLIDADEARATALSMISLSVEMPEDIRAGDPIPFRVDGKLGTLSASPYGGYSSPAFDIEVRSIRLNGKEIYSLDVPLVIPEFDYDWESDDTTSLEWVWEGAEELPVLTGAIKGNNVFEYDVRLSGMSSGWGDDSVLSSLISPGEVVGPLDFTLTKTRPVSFERDPGLGSDSPVAWSPQQSITASLSHGCSCGTSPGIEFELADTYQLPPSTAMFYDVYLECDGEEWFIGTERFTEDSDSTELLIDEDQAEKIEANNGARLIMEPSPWNARMYYDRPTVVLAGEPIERWVVFKEEEAE